MNGSVLKMHKLRSCKRHNFSLLEILVALAVLVMTSTFVGVKGFDLIHSYRFESSLERIKKEVALTHQVAMSYQIDIDFTLRQTSKGIECIRTTDERLRHLVPFFKEKILFKGLKLSDIENSPLTINFYGSGWVEPRKGFHISAKQSVAFIDINQSLSPLITSS
jgi:hypothetical protein